MKGSHSPRAKKKDKQYKGVHYQPFRKTSEKLSGKNRRAKPYSARINVDGKQVRLGYYKSAVEAAQAYDDAARRLLPAGSYLNFP